MTVDRSLSGCPQGERTPGAARMIAYVLAGLLVGIAALAWAPAARAEEGPAHNRIVDGEAGTLSGWQGSGFEIAQFGQANTPPEPLNDEGRPTGLLLEAIAGGASITQTDSLADLSGAIEAGTQVLWIEGRFGGSGSGQDGAYMTVQLLSEAGEQIGSTYQFGPASAGDRLDRTLLVPCEGTIDVPPGVRAARVTLQAQEPAGRPSTGIADSLALLSQPQNRPEIGISPPVYEGQHLIYAGGGEGPNCDHLVLSPISAPIVAPATPYGAQGASPVSPAVRISAISLTRSRVALRVSAAAKIDATVAPAGAGHDGGRSEAHRSATHTARFTLVAHAPGMLAHRFRHPLSPGRYRVTLSVVGGDGRATATRVTRLVSVR